MRLKALCLRARFGSDFPTPVAMRTEIRSASEDVTLSEQERRQAVVDDKLGDLRFAGDAVIAAHFGAENDRARGQAIERMRDMAASEAALWAALRRSADTLANGKQVIHPFHWELEFPEVSVGLDPGFDAVIGNPPFAGKNTLLAGNRKGYLPWLQELHEGAHGNADLVAHFFRRAFCLLRAGGCLGLIATNTIGQGDTRETGLRWLLQKGGNIIRATRGYPWPGEAAVAVSVIHVVRGALPIQQPPILNGRPVRRISAYLVEGDLDASPARLAANTGKMFIGHYICGSGFTFDDKKYSTGAASAVATKDTLIAENSDNSSRISPYIGGAEVNTHPKHQHSRWVIQFDDLPLGRRQTETPWLQLSLSQRERATQGEYVPLDYPGPVAEDWPDLLDIVRNLVKRERDKLPQTNSWNRTITKFWWRWGAFRKGLSAATAKTDAVWFIPNVSQYHALSLIPSSTVIGAPHNVLANDSLSAFALLQSRVHEVWAAFFASSLEDRLRYAPSDCFETFPLPRILAEAELTAIGNEYYKTRAQIMEASGRGVTKTFADFNKAAVRTSPIQRLRSLHHELDPRGFTLLRVG